MMPQSGRPEPQEYFDEQSRRIRCLPPTIAERDRFETGWRASPARTSTSLTEAKKMLAVRQHRGGKDAKNVPLRRPPSSRSHTHELPSTKPRGALRGHGSNGAAPGATREQGARTPRDLLVPPVGATPGLGFTALIGTSRRRPPRTGKRTSPVSSRRAWRWRYAGRKGPAYGERRGCSYRYLSLKYIALPELRILVTFCPSQSSPQALNRDRESVIVRHTMRRAEPTE